MKLPVSVTTFKAQDNAQPRSGCWFYLPKIRDKITELQADDPRRWLKLSGLLFIILVSFCEWPEYLPPFPVWFTSLTNSTFPRLKIFFPSPAHLEERIPSQDELGYSLHCKTIVSDWDEAPSRALGSTKRQKECVPSCGAMLSRHQLKRKM